MALFNEILAGRYNRLLQRLLSMKGAAPAPQLSGDIVAGLTLESDRPEWYFLRGEYLAARAQFMALDAANPSKTRLANPANSGAIVMMKGFYASRSSAGLLSAGMVFSGTALATSVAGQPRDARVGSAQQTTATVSRANTALTFTSASFFQHFPASVTLWVPFPVILSPGTSWEVGSTDNNVDVSVTYLWAERQLDPSETL